VNNTIRSRRHLEEQRARSDEERSFAELLTAGKDLFTNTKDIQVLAKNSLENITGDDSFVIVSPQIQSTPIGAPMNLIAWNYGAAMMTGVTVSIAHAKTDWGDQN
jgi:hypothetical protein